MDINKILKGVECNCGRKHSCDIEYVYIEKGAVNRISSICNDAHNILIVATAPSMDGYASNGAAMILKGMKETVKVGLPKAIIADVDILKNCPIEMLKAGYGDIIGKYSSLCDWKLSHVINGEYFCDYIYNYVYYMVEKTRANAEGTINREEESIGILVEALTKKILRF